MAPKNTENGKRVDTALPVYLSVDILSFDRIDTVDMMIGYVLKSSYSKKLSEISIFKKLPIFENSAYSYERVKDVW